MVARTIRDISLVFSSSPPFFANPQFNPWGFIGQIKTGKMIYVAIKFFQLIELYVCT